MSCAQQSARRWQPAAEENQTSSLQATGPTSGLRQTVLVRPILLVSFVSGRKILADQASAVLAPAAAAEARRRPFLQHLTPEAKQRGGTAAGLCRHHTGRVDQRA